MATAASTASRVDVAPSRARRRRRASSLAARRAPSSSSSRVDAAVGGDASTIAREFVFVPYGDPAPRDRASLSCDGKVDGATLDLTHWTNNATPEALYADTSTEIALNLARARFDDAATYARFDDAVVLNNHYDVDGVLSVYACVDPTNALRHREVMIAAAAAGDFGEWAPCDGDDGVKLARALDAFADDDADDEGYAAALAAIRDGLLDDIDAREDLWRRGVDEMRASWKLLEDGVATVEVMEVDGARVAVATAPATAPRLHSAAVHRKLRASGACGHAGASRAATRVLRVVAKDGPGPGSGSGARAYAYEYEKPGHGWVARLVERAAAPPTPRDVADVVAKMNASANGRGDGDGDGGGAWRVGGRGGLVAICESLGWTTWAPEEVARALVRSERECRE